MVSTTILLNSGVYRLFGTPFGIKITPPVKHYIILSNKWGAVHKEKNITPVKITLQCLRNDSSTDAADNIKKKKTVIHDMGLNLEVIDNSPIAAIIKNMQLGKVSKEAAFAQIKELQGNSEDFNDAELKLKIGKRTRSVSWNDFENIVGIHDITEELHSAYAKSKNFVAELTMLSNKYYHDIIESGVINDK